MGSRILALVAGVALGASGAAAAETPPQAVSLTGLVAEQGAVDPRVLYGDELAFGVYRDGKRVGEHRVSFRVDGDAIVVEVRFNVDVRFLGFSAYRYVYTATERWQDGRLVALAAETDDNGDRTQVSAVEVGDLLRVRGPSGAVEAPAGTFATNHWNPGVLDEDLVINSITGALSHVRIEERGVQQVQVDGAAVSARRFVYTGDLDNEVWYDDDGRWLKMRFRAEDGSTIEYVCERIGQQNTSEKRKL